MQISFTQFDCINNTLSVRANEQLLYASSWFYGIDTVWPVDGYYSAIESPSVDGYYLTTSGTSVSFTWFYGSTPPSYFSAGSQYKVDRDSSTGSSSPSVNRASYIYARVLAPVYKITPLDSVIGQVNNVYSIESRPTSITGDYGIIGDNGQIVKVEGNKIVNETNNIYTNPATGQTDTITNWSYDYSTRTYTLTLGGGTTTTVTYGDENVVIKEGDTTYNIYYLINGSGPENPDPGPDVPGTCNHQWAETSTTPATCTVPGSRLLTCSLCNETKTEAIPAPGHKWVIKQEVKNEYDSSGNQTQEGYTIWECSVCGEQQKTTDGTAPPGGGGSGSGSSGGVFSGIFGLLVDFLGFFWNTFRDFVGEGVKGFLTALMDGTSSIFGLLNPFNWGG